MGEYFDEVHASCETELNGQPCGIEDSEEVRLKRAAAVRLQPQESYAAYIELGQALSGQLRYREAAEAYSMALLSKPDDLKALRLRAGRYLSTLQTEKAYADFEKCLLLGGDQLDVLYRLGLCDYYAGKYTEAMQWFETCFPIAEEEMGIAVIYWHTLSAYCSKSTASLLPSYHSEMKVGHHFAYEKAVRVCAGTSSADEMLQLLEKESEDLHYTITAYGISSYLRQVGRSAEGQKLLEAVCGRNGFWPCYAYLAAWNDERRGINVQS